MKNFIQIFFVLFLFSFTQLFDALQLLNYFMIGYQLQDIN